MHRIKYMGIRQGIVVPLLIITLLNGCAFGETSSLHTSGIDSSAETLASNDYLPEDSDEKSSVPELEANPVICEWSSEIGTKIQKKVCMKKSQWERYNSSGSEVTSDLQRRGSLQGSSSEVTP